MIEQKLAAWGAWVRSDRDKLGYHSNYERILALAPEHDAKDAQKRSNLPFMSDDDALSIDRALSELKRRDARLNACIGVSDNLSDEQLRDMMLYTLIELRFVCNCSVRKLADAANYVVERDLFTKHTAERGLWRAIGYVERELER